MISSAKVNWTKSEALAVNFKSERGPTLSGGFMWKRHGFKYLGVFLGDEGVLKKNWEDVVEKVKGRLIRF